MIIGLTGGIGSGKTTVSDRFASHGIDVVDADLIARHVVEPGTKALKAITNHFGPTILTPDSTLDRAALRSIIFSSPEEKAWLESLLHPLIQQETQRQLSESSSPYAVYVAPLLLETQSKTLADRILIVDLKEGLQLERASQRDGATEASIQKIIDSQMARDKRRAYADDVIDNGISLESTLEQVDNLHHFYLKLAESDSP